MRLKFKIGKQREFLKNVLEKINAPSLNELSRRLGMSYGTLKCYYSEKRLIPKDLVYNLCKISNISFEILDVEIFDDNWGQVLGGKNGKRGNFKI